MEASRRDLLGYAVGGLGVLGVIGALYPIVKVFSPSAENVAKWLYERVKERYPTVQKVVVWETEDCGAEYFEV